MGIQLRIASPCEEKWESMQGDDRVRNCARCALNVYNVKEMSEPEVRALFLKTEKRASLDAEGGSGGSQRAHETGRVCGRIFQRRDGTVLMRDCPTGLAKVRRKALAALAAVVSVVLAVIHFRMGASKACPTEEGPREGFYTRVLEPRFIDARETLRDTRTFGPIINELYPVMEPVAGLMIVSPPPPSPPSP